MFNETCFRGLEGLGAIALEIDSPNQFVGHAPYYRVHGATPGADLFWDSTKNGASTGEVLSGYGHKADGNGNWSGYGGPWTSDHLGNWTKTIHDGAQGETATAAFQVIQPPAQQGSGQQGTVIYYTGQNPAAQQSGDTISIFGTEIPKTAAYVGGAALAWWLMAKRK